MTKADKLRAALRDAGNEGITSDQVKKITGGNGQLGAFIDAGEFTKSKVDGVTRFVGNAGYQPPRQRKAADALPLKRPKKKKHPRKARTLRDVAATISETPPMRLLALRNLCAASAMLRQTIAAQVDGLEDNPLLTGALENAEQAEQLARAA